VSLIFLQDIDRELAAPDAGEDEEEQVRIF
jgi:hypothetical protein